MSNLEEKILEVLNQTGLPFEVVEIDPDFSDTAAFCGRYGYPAEQTCNTIVVVSKKGPQQYAACVVLASTRLDVNRRVRELLGTAKASFAPAEDVLALTGMELGGVTPLGLPAGLSLLVDDRVMQLDWVILGGGSRRLKIKVPPAVFHKLGAQVVADLGRSG
ncbi:MAG: hypothetical protein K1Y36_26580 [Blastocatellia bacterium]|nr:hypothetical protein [Blastocatellia bacterium]